MNKIESSQTKPSISHGLPSLPARKCPVLNDLAQSVFASCKKVCHQEIEKDVQRCEKTSRLDPNEFNRCMLQSRAHSCIDWCLKEWNFSVHN